MKGHLRRCRSALRPPLPPTPLPARKADDPWAPVLVVVPSDGIRRRLAWHLAAERRLTLVNVSILTFHQLSRRLVAEAADGHAPDPVDDRAFEELLRVVIERGEPRASLPASRRRPAGARRSGRPCAI